MTDRSILDVLVRRAFYRTNHPEDVKLFEINNNVIFEVSIGDFVSYIIDDSNFRYCFDVNIRESEEDLITKINGVIQEFLVCRPLDKFMLNSEIDKNLPSVEWFRLPDGRRVLDYINANGEVIGQAAYLKFSNGILLTIHINGSIWSVEKSEIDVSKKPELTCERNYQTN